MKNALLRRKTRRPHNQPSSATTWLPTWLLSVVVAIVLYELLIRQEFITHRHLSDIGDWIAQAVVHAIVNGGTWTDVQLRKYTANESAEAIVLLRAGYATLRRFARFLSLSKGQGFRFARFLSLPPVVPTNTATNTPVLFKREVGKSPASFLFIRAIPWVLTHPHGNSYACRAEFSEISLYSKVNL
jgi:hypothetical protein